MTFPAVVFPDVERPLVPRLQDAFDDLGESVTVAVGVPTEWMPTDPPHIEVAWDGTPVIRRQIVAFATVRLVARARTTTEAKRLAALAQGLLCSLDHDDVITGVLPLTGVLATRDTHTNAELASTTSRVTVRSAPIEPSGS